MSFVLKLFSVISFICSVYTVCPSGFINYRSHSCFAFKYFDNEIISWNDAEAICKNDSNAVLASIDDKIQEDFLRTNFMNEPDVHYTVWIGLQRDPQKLEKFVWTDGSNSSYRHWEPGEPNMFKGELEYCVHFDVKFVNGIQHNGWNDAPCDSPLVHGALCQIPYEPLSGIEKKYSEQSSPTAPCPKAGIAVAGTIGAVILLGLIAFIAFIAFRKWKNIYPIIPMVQFKNQPDSLVLPVKTI